MTTQKPSPTTWLAVVCFVACYTFLLHGAEVTVNHPTMDQRIGYPAIIPPGGDLPKWTVRSDEAGILEGALVNSETDAVIQRLEPQPLIAAKPVTVTLNGMLPPEGVYHFMLRIREGDTVQFRTSSSFAVLDVKTLPSRSSVVAHPGPNGRMRYIPDVMGNRIPDFSGVGYRGGADLPVVPAVEFLTPEPGEGDARKRIQKAIDKVSAREPDKNGFRGAVELAAGIYEIKGTLQISQSGVVLRGVGPGPKETLMLNPAKDLTFEKWRDATPNPEATVLVATTTEHDPVLIIAGKTGSSVEKDRTAEILDDYVPVGRNWFHVSDVSHFKIGDTIQLERRGNDDWLKAIGMDRITDTKRWQPVSHFFGYTIKDINGDRITLDAGLVNAVERRWGGGAIRPMTEGGRIRDVGVENLRAISFMNLDENGADDTNHADQFVVFNRLRDAWADNIVAEHFTPEVKGTFRTETDTLGVTMQNSSALAPAHDKFYLNTGSYERTGRKHNVTKTYVGRYGFHFGGQNGLVKNCFALNMRHAFVVYAWVAGPNVFVNSEGRDSVTNSEPHQCWAAGGLYDNIKEEKGIALMNRRKFGDGHGWSAANYVAWNTRGPLIVEQPPTAQNWAIGHVGKHQEGPFKNWNMEQFGFSDGYWESEDRHVEPRSLYERQVADRKK